MSVKSKALVLFAGVYLLSACATKVQQTTEDIDIDQAALTETTEVDSVEFDTAQFDEELFEEESDNEQLALEASELELSGEVFDEITPTTLVSVKLSKSQESSGTLNISLSDEVPFALRKSSENEYVLELPSVNLQSSAALPQIGEAGVAGIRSARATETDIGSQVRMFVDEGISLVANANGSNIQIKPTTSAIDEEARAQLADASETDSDSVGVLSADGGKRYTGRLISLDLQDTDIDNALRIIAEVSNLNIIASDDVRGKVTLRLVDVPWDQALDVILKTNGLGQEAEGSVVRIAPVEQLRAEREARLEAKRAQENLEDLTVRYTRISYARAADMVEAIEGVLSERGSVTFDERTNQLIIKDIQKGHEQSAALIEKLDLRTPQILLETQIVEASRNLLRDLGFQWNYQFNRGPQFGNATGDNFPNTVSLGGSPITESTTTTDADGNESTSSSSSSGNIVNFPASLAAAALGLELGSADGSRSLSARLSALEQEGEVRVISRPQVATVNNKEAEIKSVEVLRIRTNDSGVSVATGSGASSNGGGATAFEEVEVGIELRVTPQASPDYYVLLDIDSESSTLGSTTVDSIPSTVERKARATILVKSGQTFALGGIYRIEDSDVVNGVPFLKDIPFFGHAFRNTNTSKSDEELIFFITPHIIEGSFDPGSFES